MNYFWLFEVVWVLEHKEERNCWTIPIWANLEEFTTWAATSSYYYRVQPYKPIVLAAPVKSPGAHSNILKCEVFLHLPSSPPGTAGDRDQLCMTDPSHVTTILTPHYKPCLPHKEHLLSEWHVFNVLIYHCQIQDFYCWILNIVFKVLFFFDCRYFTYKLPYITKMILSTSRAVSLSCLSHFDTLLCMAEWDNSNPGYSSAVPTLLGHGLCCLRKHTWNRILCPTLTFQLCLHCNFLKILIFLRVPTGARMANAEMFCQLCATWLQVKWWSSGKAAGEQYLWHRAT